MEVLWYGEGFAEEKERAREERWDEKAPAVLW
jgi:hypothetical protein